MKDRPYSTVLKNSRGADKFVLRMPEGFRDHLMYKAQQNKRSMNAEAIERLIASFDSELGETESTVATSPWNPTVGNLVLHKEYGYGVIKEFEITESKVCVNVEFAHGTVNVELVELKPGLLSPVIMTEA